MTLKRIALRIILLCFSLFASFFIAFPPFANGIEEFSTSLQTTYEVSIAGDALVKNQVTIKNNLSSVFAKQYAFEVSSGKLTGVRVYDEAGQDFPVEVNQTETKTSVAVVFSDKVIGKDQERIFTIEYQHPDVAVLAGEILEIDVPKLLQPEQFQHYSVRIVVPHKFGDPALATPASYSLQREAGKNTFSFFNQGRSGIHLIFGERQIYEFSLQYNIENPSLSQGVTQIALPPDTSYQRVYYESIEPLPESIERDEDGNWIATFVVGSQREATIVAKGRVATYLHPTVPVSSTTDPNAYLQAKPYWEVTDPEIRKLASELQSPLGIYTYLVENFTYNYDRLLQSSQRRLGASASIQNPSEALCQEFTDSFVALARAAGIPARVLNGYAYTENNRLRPLSLVVDVLHAWPEYYDIEKKQWIPVDPTWGSTTGGIDFFSKLDYNHVVFAIHGSSSDRPFPAGTYKIAGKEEKDVQIGIATSFPDESLRLDVQVEQDTQAKLGLSNTSLLVLENETGFAWYDIPVQLTTTQGLAVSAETERQIPTILPFQKVEVPITITSANSLVEQEGEVTVVVAGQERSYVVKTGKNEHLLYLGVGLGVATLVTGGILVYWRRR